MSGPSRTIIAKRRKMGGASPVLPALTLNMTAMIDCVFMLLMFFILTVDFRPREDSLRVDPALHAASSGPKSHDAGAFDLPQRPVVISVRSTGDGPSDYTLRADEPALGALASFAQLESGAASALGATLPADTPFSVLPTSSTRWEHALGAMNAVQRAGYTKVRLARPEPEL